MYFGTALLILGWHLASGQDMNCDYYQQIQAVRPVTVNSPGWPGRYRPGVTCRWIADCPAGHNCRFTCTEISLPQSTQCSQDRLLVSLTGNTQLTDAQIYCGTGSLDVLSTGTRISVGLISSPWSTGGRFTCQVTALTSLPPTPSCRCGDRNPNRIVGGVDTGVNEYPSMVAIADVRISEIACGGVVISQWHVLTAAHCVIGASAADYAVIVGEHDITVGDSSGTKAYRISSFTPHPWFTDSNYDYDISIVTVANPIEYNNAVGPACLPFKFANSELAGAKVTMLGWGTLWFGGPSSNTLQQVDVDVLTQSACRSQMSGVTDRQMCTYAQGKDSCQYDSGGPLLYTDPATNRLFSVGIISYGRFCASGYPGVNTRVTSLLNWIVQNTPGVDYCRV